MTTQTTTQKATWIWIVLMTLSAISAYIGEFGESNILVIGLVVGALVIKGQLIVDYFMDLRNVNVLWRFLLSAFCIVIGSIIFGTYLLSS